MTPTFLREGAPAAVLRALPGARAVGGAVRDFLAGRPIHDVDVAVALPPEEVSRLLRAAGLKVFETGLQHGTVTAVLDRQPVEVTSLRRDLVTDGRHAEVEWIADWREDAARRDFTINAMSMGQDGVVHDHFGGLADLEAGRVRFVGVAADRLAEDYLRALRFFRFWARYGRGEPDAAAVAAIREAVPGLARLSVERVWMELKRLLAADDPRGALRLMAETGVLGAVLPEGFCMTRLERLVDMGGPVDPLLRFAALLPKGVPTMHVASRLKQARHESDRIAEARTDGRSYPQDLSGPRLMAALALDDPASVVDHTWWADAEEAADRSALRRRIAEMTIPPFPLTGHDALGAGISAGPHLGHILTETRRWWYLDGARAPREACLAKLRELANLPPA